MKDKRTLAIDDMREYVSADIVARTVTYGLYLLKECGPWRILYLDHDMGDVELQRSSTGRELTGMDVLNFLEEFPEYLPTKQIMIVTSNGSVRQKMEKIVRKLYE